MKPQKKLALLDDICFVGFCFMRSVEDFQALQVRYRWTIDAIQAFQTNSNPRALCCIKELQVIVDDLLRWFASLFASLVKENAISQEQQSGCGGRST
jgi:hypothetical protein